MSRQNVFLFLLFFKDELLKNVAPLDRLRDILAEQNETVATMVESFQVSLDR